MLKVTKVVLKNVQDENQRLHNSNDELEQQMLELRKDMKSLKKQSRELESPINNAQQIKQEFTKLGNAQEENKHTTEDYERLTSDLLLLKRELEQNKLTIQTLLQEKKDWLSSVTSSQPSSRNNEEYLRYPNTNNPSSDEVEHLKTLLDEAQTKVLRLVAEQQNRELLLDIEHESSTHWEQLNSQLKDKVEAQQLEIEQLSPLRKSSSSFEFGASGRPSLSSSSNPPQSPGSDNANQFTLDTNQKTLQTPLKLLGSHLKVSDKSRQQLEEHLKDLEEQLVSSRDRYASVSAKMQGLLVENQQLQTELKDSKSNQEYLKVGLAASQQAFADQESVLKHTSADRQRLTDHLSTMNNMNTASHPTVHLQAQFQKGQDEMDRLHKRLGETEQALARSEQTCHEVKSMLDATLDRAAVSDNYLSMYEFAQKQVSELETTLASNTADVKARLETAQQQAKQNRDETHKLEIAKKTLEGENQKLRAEVKHIGQLHAQQTESIQLQIQQQVEQETRFINHKLAIQLTELNALKAAHERLSSAYEEISDAHSDLIKSKHDQVRQLSERREGELSHLLHARTDELNRLGEQHENLVSVHRKLSTTHDRLKDANVKLEERLEKQSFEASHKHSLLQTQLTSTLTQLQTTEVSLGEAKKMNKKIIIKNAEDHRVRVMSSALRRMQNLSLWKIWRSWQREVWLDKDSELNKHVSKLAVELVGTSSNLNHLSNKHSELSIQHTELQQQHTLKNQQENLQNQHNALVSSHRDLSHNSQQSRQEAAELRLSLVKHQLQLETSTNEKENIQQRLEETRKSLEQVKQQLMDAHELVDQKSHPSHNQADIDTNEKMLTSQLDAVVEQYKTLHEQYETLTTNFDTVSQHYATLHEQYCALAGL